MTYSENLHDCLSDVVWDTPKLLSFVELLKEWGQKTNLIATKDLNHNALIKRHIKDCGNLIPYIKKWPSFIDMGTGAGLPGIVLSILTQKHVHLVESRLKKVTFLKEAKRLLDLNVTIHGSRLEDIPSFNTPFFVSRAFKPLLETLSLMRTHLSEKTVYLCLKGASFETEVQKASHAFDFDLEVFPSFTHPEGKVLRLFCIKPR